MPWKKGQSGNPSGRPKIAEEFKELAQTYCPEALEVLVHVMRKGKTETARVLAADKILDRGYGRAPQAHTGPDGEGPIVVQIIQRPRRVVT